MKPVSVRTTVHLDSPPEKVWPLITDTDRTNRLIGLGPVTFRPVEKRGASAARFVGSTKAAGFAIEYDELPFEWVENESFGVERRMRGGPLHYLRFGVKLAPDTPGGTRATMDLEMLPRSILLWPIARFQASDFTKRIAHVARAIDEFVKGNGPSPYKEPVTPVDTERLSRAVAALGKKVGNNDLATRLGDFIRDAADADVVRMRPFELAEEWQKDRQEVLRTMLHAVPSGLLELRWSIVCPSCRTGTNEVESLDKLDEHARCQLCDISFDLDLDRAVEATFIPHRTVRKTEARSFCIGGPSRTPHVMAQRNLDPKAETKFAAPRASGRYRLFARGGASISVEVAAGGASRLDLVLNANSFDRKTVVVSPDAALHVRNDGDDSRHFKLERLGYASLAATAQMVSQEAEFRRLFSGELLKGKTPLKVSRVSILFTDLTGSTALYTNVGDAAAFRFVDDHFDVMRQGIEPHEGLIVKTMGDAVMASFVDFERAIEGCVDILERFEAFRASSEHGARTGIKLGVFSGPCYVITANDRLDYFGQTVNVASRLQHLAESSELVVEKSEFVSLPEALQKRWTVKEDFSTTVKGVETPVEVLRLVLAKA